MDARIEKINELMQSEDFAKELLSKQEAEEVQALFEENGVEMSLDEIRTIGALLDKVVSGEITAEQIEKAANGELSEEELAEVAGGVVITGTVLAVSIIAGFVGTGVLVGGSIMITNYAREIGNWFRRW